MLLIFLVKSLTYVLEFDFPGNSEDLAVIYIDIFKDQKSNSE